MFAELCQKILQGRATSLTTINDYQPAFESRPHLRMHQAACKSGWLLAAASATSASGRAKPRYPQRHPQNPPTSARPRLGGCLEISQTLQALVVIRVSHLRSGWRDQQSACTCRWARTAGRACTQDLMGTLPNCLVHHRYGGDQHLSSRQPRRSWCLN